MRWLHATPTLTLALLGTLIYPDLASAASLAEELQTKYGYEGAYYLLLFLYPVVNDPPQLSAWMDSKNYAFLCPFLRPAANARCQRPVLSTDLATTQLITAYFNSRCCTAAAAAVDGGWSIWNSWSSCSLTCGSGSQIRSRTCTSPAPANGGTGCPGAAMQSQECAQPSVNGNWGPWSPLSACSATCGIGIQSRRRSCNSPAPSGCGSNCTGPGLQQLPCVSKYTCPGIWSSWSSWTTCSASCGSGSQNRTRTCINWGYCEGSTAETKNCNAGNCTAVDGRWSSWGPWNRCSSSCDGGSTMRTRSCDSPSPAQGGAACRGARTQAALCSTEPCSLPACGRYAPGPDVRVIGGQPADVGEYPWACHLVLHGAVVCACSILDRYYVITAGHCLDFNVQNNVLSTSAYEVIAGQHNRSIDVLEPGAQRIAVVSGVRHPSYDSVYLFNDIAVLRLVAPLTFQDKVSPICLPLPSDPMPPVCTVIGWGYTIYLQVIADVLMEVEINAYNATECERIFQGLTYYPVSQYLQPGIMCAAHGTVGGRDACKGDSGSSLICLQTSGSGRYWKQFGIVSSGINGCARPGQPGYYTYLPNFVTWIYSTIESLNNANG